MASGFSGVCGQHVIYHVEEGFRPEIVFVNQPYMGAKTVKEIVLKFNLATHISVQVSQLFFKKQQLFTLLDITDIILFQQEYSFSNTISFLKCNLGKTI